MNTATNTQTGASPNPPSVDLEVKDALLIFSAVWNELEAEFGRKNLVFPREIFWINGAPGAGKGTHTRTAMKLRDLTEEPIVMSSLLNSPEARRLIDAGMLVGDREVISLLLRQLLQPRYQSGAVVDGYPRTKVQVETLKLLQEKMLELYKEFRQTPLSHKFRKPHFHILVLFIDEAESVKRQLGRGCEAMLHNQEVRASGMGELMEVRKTDIDPEAASKRYRVFKEKTFEALKSLREVFQFHYVNTHGPKEVVRERIIRELKYQSSLELEHDTFDRVSVIPLATTMALHARQELVGRLDSYAQNWPEQFQQVIKLIDTKFISIIRCHAVSGRAIINSEDPLLEDPRAIAMLIDVLSERGYLPTVNIRREEVPDKIDLSTGQITTRSKRVITLEVRFDGNQIRHGH